MFCESISLFSIHIQTAAVFYDPMYVDQAKDWCQFGKQENKHELSTGLREIAQCSENAPNSKDCQLMINFADNHPKFTHTCCVYSSI